MSPKWGDGLSVMSQYALLNLDIDPNLSEREAKALVAKGIENGEIPITRARGVGKKIMGEILKWCGAGTDPDLLMSKQDLVEKNKSLGVTIRVMLNDIEILEHSILNLKAKWKRDVERYMVKGGS